MRLITPPASPVVTLAEAKAHLRVDHSEEDAQIEAYVAAATAWVQGVCGRAIGDQLLEEAFDEFPAKAIRVPFGPLIAVVSVTYVDPAGSLQTVAPTEYEVDDYSADGWIVPVASWPETMATPNAVKIRWRAGDVPPALRQAVLVAAAHLYQHRETGDFPPGVAALIAPFRRWSI